MQAAVLAIPAGFALRIWAIRALDGAFSVSLRPQGAWVASGPYRWMRHPSELGLILAVSGAVVATGSLAGAVSAVVLVAIPSIQRVRLESQPPRGVP
jgi:protein-S-isoprenylcysteine O-methyltransferase Ste14